MTIYLSDIFFIIVVVAMIRVIAGLWDWRTWLGNYWREISIWAGLLIMWEYIYAIAGMIR
jgi:hypothetical protein